MNEYFAVSTEQIETLMSETLCNYSNAKNLNEMGVFGGTALGIITVIVNIPGYPQAKIDEYRLRIEGLSDLLRNTNFHS